MSVEPPSEPRVRHITPAPEDYASSPPARALAWPLSWIALAVALWTVL